MRPRHAKSVTRPPAWLSPVVMLVLYCFIFTEGRSGDVDCEQGPDSSGTEEKEWWWQENVSNGTNFTELCSGMIDVNSSEPIYSYPENNTGGNFSNCKCVDEHISSLTGAGLA